MEEEQLTPKWVRRLLPLLVLLAGLALTFVLVKSKRSPQRAERAEKGVLVEVLTVKTETRRVRVVSQGTVQPQQQVSLSPQVPGKVTWVHPSLKIGGMIASGAPLIKLDPVDYKLALERSRAAAVLAQKNLVETQSNAAVARREWKILGQQTGKREANPLTLYKPQLELARANMRSAKAQIKQAQVNLSRTTIRAPFNLQVRSESIEKGQYVGVGQPMATVYGTDYAEVIVPLPVAELRWIRLPPRSLGRKAKGRKDTQLDVSPVTVSMTVGGKRFTRPGLLLRSVGEIDAAGRMAKIVVGVEDPYNLRSDAPASAFQPEFQVGAFVNVTIEGQEIAQVVPIPATALRLGSRVWTVGPEDKLQLHKVEVARLTEQEALITSGLTAGERVIVTSLSSAVEGMQLRIKADAAAAQHAPTAQRASTAERAEASPRAQAAPQSGSPRAQASPTERESPGPSGPTERE